MFLQNSSYSSSSETTENLSEKDKTSMQRSVNKINYLNHIQEISPEDVDTILESETQNNKSDSWNKLNKTSKIHKLNKYAEKYGKKQNYSIKEMEQLKTFFMDSLERGKLQKTKEVIYDKSIQEITDIPSLFYHSTNRHFTLKIMDTKRVSTLKSLTPKRISEKNKTSLVNDSENI